MHTLAEALTMLRKERNAQHPRFQDVKTYIMNPKCVSWASCSGEFNITHTSGPTVLLRRLCVGVWRISPMTASGLCLTVPLMRCGSKT